MPKITAFEMDEKKENEGVWVKAGAGLDLLIARLGNKQCKKYLLQHGKPFTQKMMRLGMIDETDTEISDEFYQALAHTVLLGWKNLQDDSNQDIPYTPEKAYEFLKKYTEFSAMVLEYAQNAELFRRQEDAAIRKN